MKKTIKLTEKDLTNLVKKIINEQRRNRFDDMSDEEFFNSERFESDYTVFDGTQMDLNEFPKELREYSDTLERIILRNNHIREIPEWISEFKNLKTLNLHGNPISHIPNSIAELDMDNGGSLFRLSIDKHREKLKRLLPNTSIG